MFWKVGDNMFFRRAIVDELGNVIYWCSELSDEEIKLILSEHEEYSIKLAPMQGYRSE